MTVTANDTDLPAQPLAYSIVGGIDHPRFSVTAGGLLSFNAPPDFEAPSDSNGDNVYVVTVQASDGNGGTALQMINVSVTPVNDNAPRITSPEAVIVAENTTTVMTVTAADADLPPQQLTFSIVGGADQSKFSLTPAGVLSFSSPPDFEAPTDANGDNIYVAIVQVSDSAFTSLQAVLITVTDLLEVLPDYNGNGVVDAADYVLWRNGGPLQNDLTPGVQPDDYNVWRAHFGRTVGGAANTSQMNTVAADFHPFDSSQSHLAPANLRPGGEVTERRRVHRPARRTDLVGERSRESALVAWLASRSIESERRTSSPAFVEASSKGNHFEHDEPSINALDLAFAEV
jgi:hypothetical protein